MRTLTRPAPSERRHPRIVALELEIKQLRIAVFQSEEWAPFVADWREILRDKKAGDALERSIMARIAQTLEDRCLRALQTQLDEDGWTVLALVFDGLVVRHRTGHSFDLERLQARVHKETQLRMSICEKPLFGEKPALTLARDFLA